MTDEVDGGDRVDGERDELRALRRRVRRLEHHLVAAACVVQAHVYPDDELWQYADSLIALVRGEGEPSWSPSSTPGVAQVFLSTSYGPATPLGDPPIVVVAEVLRPTEALTRSVTEVLREAGGQDVRVDAGTVWAGFVVPATGGVATGFDVFRWAGRLASQVVVRLGGLRVGMATTIVSGSARRRWGGRGRGRRGGQ